METYWLCFTLLSDATFGLGEGLAGLIDEEVEHDRDGLPRLRGRTLKGLINEECANILYALRQQGADLARWEAAAQSLLGGPGSGQHDGSQLRYGPARPPADLRKAVREALQAPGATLMPTDVLESLTAIRTQTAVDAATGVPDKGSLRSMRVVLRQTPFEARLTYDGQMAADEAALLAACTLAFRRAGTARNRGRGRLRARLHGDAGGRPGPDVTEQHFLRFCREVTP